MDWNSDNITLIDIHSHSNISPDAADPPEDMASRAAELGVRHFGLTDHLELDRAGDEKWDPAAALKYMRPTYEKLHREYDGRMNVYFGVEMGQALHDLPAAERILAEYDFDYVIGSVHRTKHYKNIGLISDIEHERRRAIAEHYEEMLSLAEWGKFSILAHMTFLLRFTGVDTSSGLVIDKTKRSQAAFETHKPVIDKILQTIISKGIALEVNSSGYRHGLGSPMPSAEFIKRYRELGGRLITVGSDAHRTGDVAADIFECYMLLRELGFSEVCVFEKKEPKFVKI